MKQIAILMGLALLADIEPVLAQGARGGSHSASAGRSVAGYTGGSVAGYTGANAARHNGRPAVQHGSGVHNGQHHGHHHGQHHGHHHGHHHPHFGAVAFPWWWYHRHYSTAVVVPTPVYIPVPVPVYGEPATNLRYFCPDYRDYYPNVGTCPTQWLQVIPQAITTTSY